MQIVSVLSALQGTNLPDKTIGTGTMLKIIIVGNIETHAGQFPTVLGNQFLNMRILFGSLATLTIIFALKHAFFGGWYFCRRRGFVLFEFTARTKT